MLLNFLTRNSQNASIAATVGSLLALVGSVVSAIVSYHYSIVTQTRQAQLEQLSKFEASTSQIIEAGGQFIDAINTKRDLAPIRVKFSAVLASQLSEVQGVARVFEISSNKPLKTYEDALIDLNQTLRRTSGPDEMRPWAESFGRTLDSKSELSKVLYELIGVKRT